MLYLLNRRVVDTPMEKVYIFGIHDEIRKALANNDFISLLDMATAHTYSKKINLQLPTWERTIDEYRKSFFTEDETSGLQALLQLYRKQFLKGDVLFSLEHSIGKDKKQHFEVYRGVCKEDAKGLNTYLTLHAKHIHTLIHNKQAWHPDTNELLEYLKSAIQDQLLFENLQQKNREEQARYNITNPKGPRRG